jgi:glyoxylase-like metal-dependent hydrolase (beta-lactamase superfamily II)
MSRLFAAALLFAASLPAQAFETVKVADGVYALVGDLGQRSPDNLGHNMTSGFIVTAEGVVVIDTGASKLGAQAIHAAIRRITDKPVIYAINTGGQDHRWLGNGYFQAQGAELIAHAGAEADMRDRGNDQLQALRAVLGPKADGTVPTLPTRWLRGGDERLEFGGVVVELKHRGGAHTPGDTIVWLPAQRVLFSGDVIYVDRLLGVLPMSRTKAWLDTFAAIEALNPERIVPGHGRVCSLDQARRETRDYLTALRAHMKRAVDEGVDMSAAIKSFDAGAFAHLLNAAELMPGNASRVYLELERE